MDLLRVEKCFDLMNKSYQDLDKDLPENTPHDIPGEWFKGPFWFIKFRKSKVKQSNYQRVLNLVAILDRSNYLGTWCIYDF